MLHIRKKRIQFKKSNYTEASVHFHEIKGSDVTWWNMQDLLVLAQASGCVKHPKLGKQRVCFLKFITSILH